MAAPPLAAREQPGLSETLSGPRDPRYCQACGMTYRDRPLTRWLEHDPWDQVPAKPPVVVLCTPCSSALIDAHPRLYRELQAGEAFPGCMSVCLDCRFREGVSCGSPAAKLNGGPGIEFAWDKPPAYAHFCGTRGGRRTGWSAWMYSGPVRSCSAKEAAHG